jgi:hypothetical protein
MRTVARGRHGPPFQRHRLDDEHHGQARVIARAQGAIATKPVACAPFSRPAAIPRTDRQFGSEPVVRHCRQSHPRTARSVRTVYRRAPPRTARAGRAAFRETCDAMCAIAEGSEPRTAQQESRNNKAGTTTNAKSFVSGRRTPESARCWAAGGHSTREDASVVSADYAQAPMGKPPSLHFPMGEYHGNQTTGQQPRRHREGPGA